MTRNRVLCVIIAALFFAVGVRLGGPFAFLGGAVAGFLFVVAVLN